MARQPVLLLTLLLTALLMAACAAAPAGGPTLTPAALQAGKGGIRGRCAEAKSVWPQVNVVYIFAAPFSGDASGNGIYLLDPGMDPRASLDGDGYFQMINLTPGRYVLVVGPTAENSRPLLNPREHILVVQVEEGGWVELGPVSLAK